MQVVLSFVFGDNEAMLGRTDDASTERNWPDKIACYQQNTGYQVWSVYPL